MAEIVRTMRLNMGNPSVKIGRRRAPPMFATIHDNVVIARIMLRCSVAGSFPAETGTHTHGKAGVRPVKALG